MRLMISQQDHIFDIIVSNEFSPSQFEIQEMKAKHTGGVDTNIKYLNSNYSYLFKGELNNIYCSAMFSPGESNITEEYKIDSWISYVSVFNEWLRYLRREITAPNKWERLLDEMKQISLPFDNSKDKFTALEYEELKRQMNLLKEGIITIGLLPEQINILNDKIDHLTELALTMNKFDWKNLVLGSVLNLATTLALSEESRTAFFALIKVVLSPIYLLP